MTAQCFILLCNTQILLKIANASALRVDAIFLEQNFR